MYSGMVITGPAKGSNYVAPRPYFCVAEKPDLNAQLVSEDPIPEGTFEVYNYQWFAVCGRGVWAPAGWTETQVMDYIVDGRHHDSEAQCREAVEKFGKAMHRNCRVAESPAGNRYAVVIEFRSQTAMHDMFQAIQAVEESFRQMLRV